MNTIRSMNPFDNLPSGTKWIILISGLVFLVQGLFSNFIYDVFGLTPDIALKKYWLWQYITYSFVHGTFWHLFINLISLWMFGPHIEHYWGTKTFLKYYFICVLGAGIAQTFIAPHSLVVGASGGIYGLLMAFGLLFPDTVIYLFFFFPLRAIQAIVVIALMTFFFSVDAGGGSRIAHVAHLGGMLTGFLYFRVPLFFYKFKKLFQKKPTQFHVISPDKEDYRDELSKEVDRILDKISDHGVESLTEKEHETMRKYSKKHD